MPMPANRKRDLPLRAEHRNECRLKKAVNKAEVVAVL